MSSSGIYFESTSDSLDMPAQREVPIRFVVNLEDGVDGFPVHLDCLGRVMRVEEAGTLMRVGATIDKARIRT